jgi:aminoglycoside phosphotransferase (APT) family kinase protein
MQPGWIVGHRDSAPYNAVMDGGRLVGFFHWDTASPSPPDDDLAFSALLWVPLTAPNADGQSGSHDATDRSRRLHLLLDTYGYDGGRPAFGAVIVRCARQQAGVIRSMADAGDRAAIALLPIASRLEQAASHVLELPGDFWTP